ncbi:GIY-YIG nuclease family protein [Beduini massiliensis]|uniref:GIY-YIG nuclease family protein n=1 Tax=Beduini massiliensis TaxID=1585974 RepID=UPI00059AA6AB|nr:GIY-YIG nuclease family protein [Beduini massiliensis]
MNGYIYILTNPSFKEYVKIGYADDVQKRLNQLNRSECIPFAFRIYAIYEVEMRLSDKKIHSIIDKLNPNLRSIETFAGKKRVREFYAMSPEDAYSILEAMAEIHGRTDKLMLVQPSDYEEDEEEIAIEIEAEHRERLAPFQFPMCNIKPGSILEFWSSASTNTGITCKVVNNKQVEFQNKLWSLSALATKLLGSKWGVAGPRYFKCNGQWLNDIREKNESVG